MYIGYNRRLQLCIKRGYSSQEMASLPVSDATQADELLQFALPGSPPLPISALLFGGDPHALAAALPTITAHSGQLAPPPHDVLIEAAPLAPPPSPSLFHGNHEDVAVIDTARVSAHSGDRYLHYGEENSAAGNEIATAAQSRFYQASVFLSLFKFSLPHNQLSLAQQFIASFKHNITS